MGNLTLRFRRRLLQMISLLVFGLSVLSVPAMAVPFDFSEMLSEGHHVNEHGVTKTRLVAKYDTSSDGSCRIDMSGNCLESDVHQRAGHGWHSGHCFDGIAYADSSGKKAQGRPVFLLVFNDALVSRAPDTLQRPPNS